MSHDNDCGPSFDDEVDAEDGVCEDCGEEGPTARRLCWDCWSTAEQDQNGDEYDGQDGEPDFADPGGNSALRAATRSNPRNLPCPECGEPDRLTPADVARHYRCDQCSDQAEQGGY